MRYTLLRPAEPVDPRDLNFASNDALNAALPIYKECDLQSQAMQEVRALYPDCVVMPVPLRLGSGDVFLLGVLPDVGAPRDPDAKIPFVMFVMATAQHGSDTTQIKKRQQWDRRLWKPPVLKTPTDADPVEDLDIEFRASDLEQPIRMQAEVYTRTDRNGVRRLVMYLELGGVEMSIEVMDPTLAFGPRR